MAEKDLHYLFEVTGAQKAQHNEGNHSIAIKLKKKERKESDMDLMRKNLQLLSVH